MTPLNNGAICDALYLEKPQPTAVTKKHKSVRVCVNAMNLLIDSDILIRGNRQRRLSLVGMA